MKGNLIKKLSACALCAAMTCSAVPAQGLAVSAVTTTASSGTIAFSTDFEDGNTSMFSKRGDSDTFQD